MKRATPKAKPALRQFAIKSSIIPIVEMSPDGIYVTFKPSAKATKTIVKRRWPVVAVDLDKNDEVIGVECAPAPAKFTLMSIARDAGVHVPEKSAARAEFQNIEKLQALA